MTWFLGWQEGLAVWIPGYPTAQSNLYAWADHSYFSTICLGSRNYWDRYRRSLSEKAFGWTPSMQTGVSLWLLWHWGRSFGFVEGFLHHLSALMLPPWSPTTLYDLIHTSWRLSGVWPGDSLLAHATASSRYWTLFLSSSLDPFRRRKFAGMEIYSVSIFNRFRVARS